MSGILPVSFRRMAEAGIVKARHMGRNTWELDAKLIYSLVSARHPSVVVGRAVWVTCGRHVQLFNPLELPPCCPGQPGYNRGHCGERLHLATVDDVVSKVVSAKERREALAAFRQSYASAEE